MFNLISLFQKLSSIDSVSGEEEKVAQFIFSYLKNLKLSPIIDKNNQIYCQIGNGKNPLLFCAHMDTVEPGRGIKIKEKDGYLVAQTKTIIGADNKVAIASILQAISDLLKEEKKLNLELLFTVREETNSGIKEFNQKLLKAKKGVIFDLSNYQLEGVVLKAPYIYDFEFEFFGQASHAAKPELGKNVLDLFIKVFSQISFGRIDKDTTFNLGIIKGGQATNTVMDYLVLKGDIRSGSKRRFFSYLEKIEKTFQKLSKKTGIKYRLNWQPYAFGYQIKKNDRDYLLLKKIYQKMNLQLKPVISNGGSDAGFLNKIGIKTFCLADGIIDPHTTKERIKIFDFYQLLHITKKLMLEFNY